MAELRRMDRAAAWANRLSATGQEWLAAWLLNTTQDHLKRLGLKVRAAP